MTQNHVEKYFEHIRRINSREKNGQPEFKLMHGSLTAAKHAILEMMRNNGANGDEIISAGKLLGTTSYSLKNPTTKMGDVLLTAVAIHGEHGNELLHRVAGALSTHSAELLKETRKQNLTSHAVANPLLHINQEVGSNVKDFLNPLNASFFRGDIAKEELTPAQRTKLLKFLADLEANAKK